MTFTEWVDAEIAAARCATRVQVYRMLGATMRTLGVVVVSEATLGSVDRGAKLRSYTRAKAIEAATGGEVTAQELCE